MARKPKPVTAVEIERAVLATIVREFAGRPLDVQTAQIGLANAAYEVIMMHLRTVAQPPLAISKEQFAEVALNPSRRRSSK